MKIKYIVDETFNGNRLQFDSVLEEVVEMIEAKTNKERLTEFKQVQLYLLVMLYQFTNWNFTVPKYIEYEIAEDFRRFDVWKAVLNKYSLKFDLAYFHVGNNPCRIEKVEKVFNQAGYNFSSAEELNSIYNECLSLYNK